MLWALLVFFCFFLILFLPFCFLSLSPPLFFFFFLSSGFLFPPFCFLFLFFFVFLLSFFRSFFVFLVAASEGGLRFFLPCK